MQVGWLVGRFLYALCRLDGWLLAFYMHYAGWMMVGRFLYALCRLDGWLVGFYLNYAGWMVGF